MALQYSTGSMFLGNSTSTNEQSSLIGNTKFTHASALTGTLAISKASAADVKLTTEIHLLSTEGDITIDPNSQQLTTAITPVVLFATAPAQMLPLKALLTLSITVGLDAPGIKDITPALSIIDSTDTYSEINTQTEVI